MNTQSFVLFALCIVPAFVFSEKLCDGSKKVTWKVDPESCRTFYLCFGNIKQKYTCPEDTVYNELERTCVQKLSPLDKCTRNAEVSLSEECKKTNTYFVPSEESCSKYMNCATSKVEECYYPFLFDQDTRRCVPPNEAHCGSRSVPKDPCDYEENQCRSTQGCIPCSVRYPSCVGLQNGLNPWPEREGSPYYVVCKDERVVYHSQCDFENKNEIFHPQKRACVQM